MLQYTITFIGIVSFGCNVDSLQPAPCPTRTHLYLRERGLALRRGVVCGFVAPEPLARAVGVVCGLVAPELAGRGLAAFRQRLGLYRVALDNAQDRALHPECNDARNCARARAHARDLRLVVVMLRAGAGSDVRMVVAHVRLGLRAKPVSECRGSEM